MGNNKDWYVQWVSAAPPMSEVKCPIEAADGSA
jgi:hypothetical protein